MKRRDFLKGMGAIAVSQSGLKNTPPPSFGLAGAYTDQNYLYNVYFGACSHWIYPSRAYFVTLPAAQFLNGIGINFNPVGAQSPDLLAQHFAKNGFKRARIEIGWGNLDYATASVINAPTQIAALQACFKWGLRPLMLLNANQGLPCPALSMTHTVTVAAAQGATTVTLDNVSDIVPGYSGFSNLTGYTMCEVLITSVAGNVCTLSQPLTTSFAQNQVVNMNTFKYRPFAVSGDPQYNATEQAATMAGWNNYVTVIGNKLASIVGAGNFDMEIWNEVTFGSQFLFLNWYYGGTITNVPDIRTNTCNTATGNPSIFNGVLISDGLSNQTPFVGAADEPVRVGALGKHPYPRVLTFPAGQTTSSTMVDANYNLETYPYFVPTYSCYCPEYYGLALQTETITRDLTYLVNSTTHGSGARVPPCPVRITEIGIQPAQVGISDIPTCLDLKARGVLRQILWFINKGAFAVDIFAATGNQDFDFTIALYAFLVYISNNSTYPVPDTSLTSPILLAVRNTVAVMSNDLDSSITTGRQLTVNNISDFHNNAQFAGDGTAAHPNGYDRELVQLLPFQVNSKKFVLALYVMTMDITKHLAPEQFIIQIDGFNKVKTLQLFDPITGLYPDFTYTQNAAKTLILTINLVDYPYLLTVQEH